MDFLVGAARFELATTCTPWSDESLAYGAFWWLSARRTNHQAYGHMQQHELPASEVKSDLPETRVELLMCAQLVLPLRWRVLPCRMASRDALGSLPESPASDRPV